MNDTNYSYVSSLPAYHSNAEQKQFQKDMIYSLVLQKRKTCLKELANLTGLEQSTVSGRVNDLVSANKVTYSGTAMLLGRMRKVITPVI